jgi:microcompartment protein CcmK/EutM
VLVARVVGNVVCTRKDETLAGQRLLLIQPIRNDGKDQGKPLVALDAVGAGADERVFYVRGKEASFPFLPEELPSDATIVGIVDRIYAGA